MSRSACIVCKGQGFASLEYGLLTKQQKNCWVRGWGNIASCRPRVRVPPPPSRFRVGQVDQKRFIQVAKISTAIMYLNFPRDSQNYLVQNKHLNFFTAFQPFIPSFTINNVLSSMISLNSNLCKVTCECQKSIYP